MDTIGHENSVERKPRLAPREPRMAHRLRDRNRREQPRPMFTAGSIHQNLTDKARRLAWRPPCRSPWPSVFVRGVDACAT